MEDQKVNRNSTTLLAAAMLALPISVFAGQPKKPFVCPKNAPEKLYVTYVHHSKDGGVGFGASISCMTRGASTTEQGLYDIRESLQKKNSLEDVLIMDAKILSE